ncbi:long chain acyl-CoA synthetase 2 [Panicum miliaceum]|uniref:Long-chain-fatty-acid--CoA ligase n=1 Tax=Panicum miliaceum TaxID=4540 RepID=A0A3L6PNU3_PANMI|nr:long chain acyl-CoA synthetase 2 [Panicum miliaceum]
MAEMFTVKVGEAAPAGGGRPAAGPVYRSVYAKDGLMELPQNVQSPWDFFSGAIKKYPKNRMLGQRQVTDGKAGEYVWQTYEEVYQKVMRIGSAIRSFGVNPGSHCGIYGSNCPEWVMAMQACNSQGICYVPLYDTLGANAVEFIMDHAEISIAFVQESKIKSILAVVPKCTAHLRAIVSFGDFTREMKKEAEKFGVSCFSWEEFCSMGKQNYEHPKKQKDDICTIMYTSGTTGDPKGVIITNRAIIAGVMTTEHLLKETDKVITEEDSYFSYLPLAHIFDQVIENYCISKGASIGFWQGDIRYLMEDVQVMKPTIFCGVPRVYDRIYTGINLKIQSGGMLAKHLFQYAYNYKLANMRKGLKQHEASPFFDKIVFSKIKEGLGGRIRLMIAGAAPLPGQIEEFMRVTSCSVFVQGYGLTESCAGCFTSIANVFSMIGTVGPPVTTIEARLESVPEMGYDALSETPRGEICLRGHTLFSGYYKRPSLTEEVFSDGWFHTGDIGEWQPNGAMKIIDRKKNIFKLSQGEYVAVEVVESAYMQSPLVASVWVYGNSFESFLVAVVVPERQALEEWAATNNKAGDFAELCNDPKARGYIQDELNKTGKKLGLRGFEMLKAVHLEPVPFSIEKDLITPTFKLKRPQLLKYYKDHIDQMYKDAKDARTAL